MLSWFDFGSCWFDFVWFMNHFLNVSILFLSLKSNIPKKENWKYGMKRIKEDKNTTIKKRGNGFLVIWIVGFLVVLQTTFQTTQLAKRTALFFLR